MRTIFACLLALLALAAPAEEYAGKAIFIPADLKAMDLHNPESKWSFSRMACTENVVVFWAKEFGDNPAEAPDLEGQNMKVDLANLLARLEQFYRFYYHDLAWVKPGTKADRYRMMVMLDYSLEGTAYGGDYDGEIGALWVTPNRLQDKRLNCIAHELGHSFQLQISCDGEGVAWGGNGIFEMGAQWMLWQVNPDWQTDERYHLDAFKKLTHKAFLHIDNIYHSPYVIEYWGTKHGLPFVAELFRQGRTDEDPVMTYKRITGISQQQFNDEMFEASRRMVNWDFDRVRPNSRPYADCGWETGMVAKGKRWMPAPENCPENYGFNVVALEVPAPGKAIAVDFRGEPAAKGYFSLNPSKAGWRYGLVAIDSEGNAHYTPAQSAARGKIRYTAPEGAPLRSLYLVVMGAPTEHWRNIDGDENPGDAQWPYSIALEGTALK